MTFLPNQTAATLGFRDPPLVYLASPFSHGDKSVEAKRAEQAAEMAAYLMQCGVFVFAPIPHGVMLAKYGLPTSYNEFWKPYCHATLTRCTTIIVLALDGWTNSTGVNDEMQLARDLGKAVLYLEYGDLEHVKEWVKNTFVPRHPKQSSVPR